MALSISRRSSGREFDSKCADVLIQALELPAARDGNNPRLLGKQPGERDLSRCRSLLFSDPGKQINDHPVGFARLRRKARQAAADIDTGEGGVFVDLSGEIAPAQRAERHEADPKFLACRQHFLLNGSPPQRVFALDCRDRLDGVGAADGFRACFRKAKVLDLACLDQVLHRSRHIFDGHVRVNPVLVKQINGLNPEALERSLGDPLDLLWPAVQANRRTLAPYRDRV